MINNEATDEERETSDSLTTALCAKLLATECNEIFLDKIMQRKQKVNETNVFAYSILDLAKKIWDMDDENRRKIALSFFSKI